MNMQPWMNPAALDIWCNDIWGLNKMADILQTTFCWMKSFVFWFQISLKIVPEGSIDSIGSDNGLALNKWQAIT